MLSNAYFLANIRFDTAENEPAKNLQNFGKPPDAAGEGAPVQVCSIVRQEQARKQTPGRTSNGPQDGRDGSHTDDAKEQLDTQASAQRTAYLWKKQKEKQIVELDAEHFCNPLHISSSNADPPQGQLNNSYVDKHMITYDVWRLNYGEIVGMWP